ncbi:unnamed protein product [Paramecium octaurelia]|uniref:Uncharacterized protein n=1 Tax=Paramecium octaurelia TaxID=43137 RepID=A0A8S1W4R6_PAROT|nr:unnamed protein product [Paramecium octaurelia]
MILYYFLIIREAKIEQQLSITFNSSKIQKSITIRKKEITTLQNEISNQCLVTISNNGESAKNSRKRKLYIKIACKIQQLVQLQNEKNKGYMQNSRLIYGEEHFGCFYRSSRRCQKGQQLANKIGIFF